MIKLRTIGNITRLFIVIWIKLMKIPLEILQLAPYRKKYSNPLSSFAAPIESMCVNV